MWQQKTKQIWSTRTLPEREGHERYRAIAMDVIAPRRGTTQLVETSLSSNAYTMLGNWPGDLEKGLHGAKRL